MLLKKKIIYLIEIILMRILSDKQYLKIKYKLEMNKNLNLDKPQTFNEKLQWIKIYDRKDIYTKMVDKYEAKKYVTEKIGEKYIISTLGIYNKFDDINFDQLPEKFVIKCTHNSGGVVICKNKKEFDKRNAKKIINKNLKRNFFYFSREWPYKNVQPRIIIEKYMENKEKELNDYKFFCFNGKPYIILVCSNRKNNSKNTDFFDLEWNKLDLTRAEHENSSTPIEKPKKLKEMIEIAEKLSQNMRFLRVDLYEINDEIYFGELTFFPSGGFEGFKPEKWDKKLGDMIQCD